MNGQLNFLYRAPALLLSSCQPRHGLDPGLATHVLQLVRLLFGRAVGHSCLRLFQLAEFVNLFDLANGPGDLLLAHEAGEEWRACSSGCLLIESLGLLQAVLSCTSLLPQHRML